jgi:predicted Zn-dependent protease
VQEGILHAMFGRLQEAEAAFRKAIAEDPTLVSPYVNLANVKLMGNDDAEALQVVRQGLARNADSALLNLLAARIYSARGDAANSAVYLARAQKTDPGLAVRFAQLAPTAGSASGSQSQRSAEAGTTPIVIWGADQ